MHSAHVIPFQMKHVEEQPEDDHNLQIGARQLKCPDKRQVVRMKLRGCQAQMFEDSHLEVGEGQTLVHLFEKHLLHGNNLFSIIREEVPIIIQELHNPFNPHLMIVVPVYSPEQATLVNGEYRYFLERFRDYPIRRRVSLPNIIQTNRVLVDIFKQSQVIAFQDITLRRAVVRLLDSFFEIF